ncbi:hypothetical protein JQS43_11585 [Natronosporangium hydrolyticum]|uniref:Uncharacterized protein n=1 Tax=Natronosporangium hydrolyticum TaxID=2811111 RepID=A0A895YLK8_9ACTN|nr:hypothetical protein [Natronosporangium hydrolyticum]QSB16862.1 hypothetical protein JQS43_11585 [Natronosporangium hydrolyticum]
MVRQRGYWRESDGSPVTAPKSWEIWAGHAYELLTTVARRYHAIITYGEVGEKVQAASGVRTSALLHNWIGPVLGKVVHEAHRRGDPPLTALVVHAGDGMVGVGYEEVLKVEGLPSIVDEMEREQHAAAARLRCYRHFGAEIPPDGGTPALAPKLEATRERRRRNQEPSPRPLCPSCFLQLPATGWCDNCGA